MGTTIYEKFVGNAAENYERYFVPTIGRPAARRVIDAAALEPGERVLDLACGTGVAARLAAEKVGDRGRIVGVDATPPMVEVAQSLAPAGPDTEWHVATAEDLPLDDNSFDAVVCSQGLQFFTDKAAALKEVWRVLIPGGRAVLGTPGPTPPLFGAIDEVLAGHMGPQASFFVHVVFSVHDPDEVRELLHTAGFTGVEVTTSPLPLRVAPPRDFLWQYVNSTPLAMMAAELDDTAKAAMEREMVERCEPFLDGDALAMEPNYLVATAYRS